MITCRFLVLGCVLRTALTFRAEEGCEAKSEWKAGSTWHEFNKGAWLSKDNEKIMELKMEFEGQSIEEYHDKINIYWDKYEFTKVRDLTDISQSHNISVSMKEGWNEFLFRIDNNYTMWHIDEKGTKLLLNNQTDYVLQSIDIKGSNITLNCPSNRRLWHVSGSHVIVPLDSSELHRLIFYSKREMVPSITLGPRREFSLRWDGQTITTLINKPPLPPYRLHNITIACSSSRLTTCIVKVGDDEIKLEEIPMDKLPESVVIRQTEAEPFSVILHVNVPAVNNFTSTTSFSRGSAAMSPSTITLMIVLILLVIGVGVLMLYFVKVKKLPISIKRNSEKTDGIHPEVLPLLNHQGKEKHLLLAVRHDDLQIVKDLLKTTSVDSEDYKKAYKEAHLLCRRRILELLDSVGSLERKTIIREVKNDYDHRVTRVFEAARNGYYRHGVVMLLQEYELPATITDVRGCSLLHVIASAKNSAGEPQWNAAHLREFLENKTSYANAVDYKGKTCLHLLAEEAECSKTLITWDGEEMPLESVWVKMADILVKYGCDPRIKDAKGQLPQENAKARRNVKLSTFLEESCNSCNNKNIERAKFDDLLKFVQEGNAASLMEVMVCHQELLPLDTKENPLTVSVTRGHLEVTMLLLSGGAWRNLCGRSVVSITPLEAVHEVKSLPALFPAIMRRECINRLTYERTQIGDNTMEKLRQYVNTLIRNVEKGILTSFTTNQANEPEVRTLLCMAAGLGLSLTCQMIGLENVNLQPNPEEDKPTNEANKNGHHDVIFILYRDLQISAFAYTDIERLSKSFLKEVWISEFRQLQSVCKDNLLKECLKEIEELPNVSQIKEVEKEIFSLISKLGLVYILHNIKTKMETTPDINDIVDELTGCTMLHIAAMYGRFSMVEYLLYDSRVDIMAKSKAGFTAAHMAATRGHKECMNYLELCMKIDLTKTAVGSERIPTSSQLLDGYQALVEESKVLLNGEEELEVWSAPSARIKTRISLENKFLKNHVSDESTFLQFVRIIKNYESLSRDKVLEEMEVLLQAVSKADERFQGCLVACRSNADDLDIPIETMQIYWEVNSHIFNSYSIKHGSSPMKVSFDSKELDNKFSLTDEFYNAVRDTLRSFEFKSSSIWLLYPSIIKERIGVTLLLLIYENGKSKLLSVLLVPVLKADYPEENKRHIVHPIIKEIKPMVYLAQFDKNWTFVTVRMEDEIIKQLKEEQKLVLIGCKILTKILYSCWWFPMLENRRHCRTWHSYAICLQTLPDRVLTSLFLEEINSTNNDDWDQSKFLDRVIAIFRRAVDEDINSELRPKDNIKLFLDQSNSTFKPNILIPIIIKFLQNIKNGNCISLGSTDK